MVSIASMAIMVAGAMLMQYPPEIQSSMWIAALALPFSAWILTCHSVFIASQKIKLVAVTTLVESVLFLLLGAAVVTGGYGIIHLFGSLVATKLLSSALNLFVVYRFVAKIRFQWDKHFFMKMLEPVAAFGLAGFANQIYMRIDIVMLSRMQDMARVGLYSSASKLWEMCLILPLGFYVVNLPIAARYYQDFRETARETIQDHTGAFFTTIFFVFGFGLFFAKPGITLLYGTAFQESALVFRILMIAFMIQSAEMVLGMSCQAAGYHRFAMYTALTRAGANMALNFLLIPWLGILGAALATVLSVAVSFIVFQVFVVKTLHGFDWARVLLKPALSCAMLMPVLYAFTERLNTQILGLLFCGGYVLLLLLLKGFSFKTKPSGV
jgi:O-antigen/teichoic acid export membrane protein